MLAKQQFETSKSREFLLLNALQIAEIPKLSRVYIPSQKHLYFFPFNSFGNMPSPDKIINSFVSLENSSFMLFTYQTSSKANNERLKYYQNCGYLNLSIKLFFAEISISQRLADIRIIAQRRTVVGCSSLSNDRSAFYT